MTEFHYLLSCFCSLEYQDHYTENDLVRLKYLTERLLEARNNEEISTFQFTGLHFLCQYLKQEIKGRVSK